MYAVHIYCARVYDYLLLYTHQQYDTLVIIVTLAYSYYFFCYGIAEITTSHHLKEKKEYYKNDADL